VPVKILIMTSRQHMPSDTVLSGDPSIFFSGKNIGYRPKVTRATTVTVIFLAGLAIIATVAVHAMFAHTNVH
jgi:hypothetical protein